MFVRKSTHDAAIAVYEQRLSELGTYNHGVTTAYVAQANRLMEAEGRLRKYEDIVEDQRRQLERSWFRNERGHYQRHPLNVGGAK